MTVGDPARYGLGIKEARCALSCGTENRSSAMTSGRRVNAKWLEGAYTGEIVTFDDLASMQELAGWAQDFCHDKFRLSDPPQLHRVLAGEALVQYVQRARKAFGQALERAEERRCGKEVVT